MSAHTPGEWKLYEPTRTVYVGDRQVARAMDTFVPYDEADANAALIARAPDLLTEVAALRAELEQVKADALGAATFTRTVDGENAALRLRVEALCEAIEELRWERPEPKRCWCSPDWVRMGRDHGPGCEKARAALAGGEG